MLKFKTLNEKIPESKKSANTVYLTFSTWNDYSFRTLFILDYVDPNKRTHRIGQIKIGFEGQTEDIGTYEKMQKNFERLDRVFFSLAESPEFYAALYSVGEAVCKEILQKLNCVVVSDEAMRIARREFVFQKSLLRDVNINTVNGQFTRIINGEQPLTEFDFRFLRVDHHRYSDMYLDFNVDPFAIPPTNIHAIIGRNGLGKTTLLNEMISSIVGKFPTDNAYFEDLYQGRISNGYFSAVISVSFSAFDPFNPISEQNDPLLGTCYYYIGLKKTEQSSDRNPIEDIAKLHHKCAMSVYNCLADDSKREIWLQAITDLESDTNFRDLDLKELVNYQHNLVEECLTRVRKMSSGHAIVFMIVSNLVEKLQDKTLVLFDEPESHLHPPLLSAFIRALSSLLFKRNGIAIMATHSPVVVQEIPRSCCWMLTRFGDITKYSRPSIETFAENVGTLTKEVFKLEMEQSGFHKLLRASVDEGLSFHEIMKKFKKKIGFEGQAVLMSMIMLRDSNADMEDSKGGEDE